MSNTSYNLVKASLLQADGALRIFKINLSPTSLDALAKHTVKHINAMLISEASRMDLVPIIVGLMLKLTCEKEVQAFLKAEEAADAVKED